MLNRSMPPGDVIPELPYVDVDAACAWLSAAFGFRERLRIGSHRIQMIVGAAAVVAVRVEAVAGSSVVMVRVADVDAHYRRAVAMGASVSGAPVSYPYGERQYSARDLAGHCWVFSQSVADVDPADWGGRWPDPST